MQTDYEDLDADMAQVKQDLETMVKHVRLAWVHQASKTLVPSGRIVGIMDKLDEGPILSILSKSDFLGADKDAAVQLLAALAEAEPADRDEAAKAVSHAEAVILVGMMDNSTATILYEKALLFARTHRLKDPNQTEIGELLHDLDVNLRGALGINEQSKYNMKRKPDMWKEDIKVAFTYYFLSFRAWTPQ
jgi:hypothetical protein